jgi:Uncharacterized protein conserved in bacteria
MKKLFLFICIASVCCSLNAQDKLYKDAFPLSSITLLDGPFKHACDLNVDVLLQYDTDRLLAPFLQEAGLSKKAEYFPNWQGLDGHVGGHYLSALAIHYAATGNKECKERMKYVLSEMKRCQDANGDGYIGGVPDGKKIWSEIRNGNPQIVWDYWVPWYNIHKTFAGLRDAWLYAGNETAKDMFLKLCDWGVSVTSPLTDEQMKSMVGQEYGGMNEIYADAYQITRNERYLWTAKRFGSDYLFDSMSVQKDELDNRHANTQVPKAVGYQRTGEVSGDRQQSIAGEFFWETVTGNRSLSFGGNSRREHFPTADNCSDYMEEREGPESCNTYNMLKLTEGLFRMNPQAKYADYYERAMFNHILSTQHPEHGGYVYFTSARPAHYRNYSQPNSGMWCCVGTGMENHGKYGEFIYTHTGDSLYVNLFVASELDWKEKGVKLIQNTGFPQEESTRLTVRTKKTSRFTVVVRCPGWVQPGKMKVVCGGKDYAINASPSSYIAIDRKWKNGDVIEISFPMKVSIEELPNEPGFISILRGPIVLGARMGTHDLQGLVADDHRWAHIAHGSLVSLFETPTIIGTKNEIQSRLENMQPVAGKPFNFTVPGLFHEAKYKDLVLEPFSGIHDSRYSIYWMSFTEQEYKEHLETLAKIEREKILLDERSIDVVTPGEQQPEIDHQMKSNNSGTGFAHEEGYRDARGEDGFFSYNLLTKGNSDLSLMVRYWGNEGRGRAFDILIDDQLLVSENLSGKWNKEEFVNVEYKIPSEMLNGKKSVTVTFKSKDRNVAGGVFKVRLVRDVKFATNPIIWADVPDNAMIRVGDTYYMSSTTMHMNPGLPIMKSKDLANWEMLNYAYETLVDNDQMNLDNGKDCYGAGSWASSFRYHNGTYYVSTFSSTSGKTHVYSTKDIEKGDWEETSFSPSLHDHTLFFDDDGRVYLLYGAGDIQIIELTSDASAIKEGGINQIAVPNATAVAGGTPNLKAEGSQMIKHNGKYYLFNITWPRNDMRTELVHRADNILGPYEGRVFLKDRGIAQGSIIDTPDGKWYAYQFRDFGAVGRIPHLMPVVWEDGWPVVAGDGNVPTTLDIPAINAGMSNIVVSDEFSRKKGDPKLPLAWQWNHNPVNSLWSLDARPGYLRITTGRIDTTVLHAKNMLTQRTFGPESSATTALDVSKMKDGDYAGFIALQKGYGFVGVKMEGDSKFIIMVMSGDEKVSIPVSEKMVYLRIDCDYRPVDENRRNDTAYFYYSLDGKKWTKIGDPLPMRYTLPHFMGYRFGLFNYATKTTGGYVDFDYFRVSDKINY